MEEAIYQLKITLKDISPSIWRRFLVKNNITFHHLHTIIQDIMGWENYHLYEFKVNEVYISAPNPDEFRKNILNSQRKRLNTLITEEGQRFLYAYDFGDDWIHQILVEKILPYDEKLKHPVCLKGKRACPLEDCGGSMGHVHLLEVLKNPEHKEYEDIKEWAGEDYDPEYFNLDYINRMLKNIRW